MILLLDCKAVPIPDDVLDKPPGEFSPKFPTLHSLGWDDARVEKANAKVQMDDGCVDWLVDCLASQ